MFYSHPPTDLLGLDLELGGCGFHRKDGRLRVSVRKSEGDRGRGYQPEGYVRIGLERRQDVKVRMCYN